MPALQAKLDGIKHDEGGDDSDSLHEVHIDVELAPFQYSSAKDFIVEEAQRRITNAGNCQNLFFLSHASPKCELSDRKKRIISYLSAPKAMGGAGLAYWADFLDLEEPKSSTKWSKDIKTAIASCSKF
eukprot:scaffold85412_cov24-Prasinocladus_malaysianus.AAC.1